MHSIIPSMRAFVLVFVGLGLLFLTIAGGAFLYGTWFRIQAEKVDGAVVEVALRHYADGNAYCPVIRYSVSGGHSYTHYSDICSGRLPMNKASECSFTSTAPTPNACNLTTSSPFGSFHCYLVSWGRPSRV
ncbi:MAG TPA: hypothetical protein VI703_03545 [Anaerolineales bacterium]|nr:hypothetical protein [Anaerolineales bacterium]